MLIYIFFGAFCVTRIVLLSDIEEGYVLFLCPLDTFCGQSDFTLDVLLVR